MICYWKHEKRHYDTVNHNAHSRFKFQQNRLSSKTCSVNFSDFHLYSIYIPFIFHNEIHHTPAIYPVIYFFLLFCLIPITAKPEFYSVGRTWRVSSRRRRLTLMRCEFCSSRAFKDAALLSRFACLRIASRCSKSHDDWTDFSSVSSELTLRGGRSPYYALE